MYICMYIYICVCVCVCMYVCVYHYSLYIYIYIYMNTHCYILTFNRPVCSRFRKQEVHLCKQGNGRNESLELAERFMWESRKYIIKTVSIPREQAVCQEKREVRAEVALSTSATLRSYPDKQHRQRSCKWGLEYRSITMGCKYEYVSLNLVSRIVAQRSVSVSVSLFLSFSLHAAISCLSNKKGFIFFK